MEREKRDLTSNHRARELGLRNLQYSKSPENTAPPTPCLVEDSQTDKDEQVTGTLDSVKGELKAIRLLLQTPHFPLSPELSKTF